MAAAAADTVPSDKAAWAARSDRGPHRATLESGQVVEFVVPDSNALIRANRLPDELAEIAIMAKANHTKDNWLEIRLVESFCVTPLAPPNTRAIAAKTNQPWIIGAPDYMLSR